MSEHDRDLLTASELSERLQVPASTVMSWMRAGTIPCVRLGRKFVRFSYEEVHAAILKGAREEREAVHA